jgi:5'-nucleotidase
MSSVVHSAKRLRVPVLIAAMLVALASLVPGPSATADDRRRTVNVQILAINDFHGNLQPPAGSSGRINLPTGGTVDAGGAEYLDTHIAALEKTNKNTIVAAAGDLIGASPLLSALFHDEPTIESMNLMGLDVAAVGNHEFDEGTTELLRMQGRGAGDDDDDDDGDDDDGDDRRSSSRRGCHPVDGCQDGDGFGGADFQYLSANVVSETTGKTLLPAVKIIREGGVKIGFIGMTLEGTPSIVTPSGVAGYDFLDEADTANRYAEALQDRGVETIVVLIHEGGFPTGFFNECPGISGAIVDIVNRMVPSIDVVISGHTHQAYNCVINNKPVTSASSFGRVITDVDLTIDKRSGNPVGIVVENRIVTRNVALDPRQTGLIAEYNEIAAPLANRVIGSITADITRTANAAGESALGDVIADAQLDATDDPGFGDAVVAFMNPGGIRADFTFLGSPAGEGNGNVTYGEAFTVQPFGNSMVTMTLTGAQIDAVLEQQLFPGRILQVSEGFTYTWSASAPTGSKVSSIAIDGVPIDPTASYRVTVNSFLADGGDGFTQLTNGTDRLGGDVDTDALEKYFVTHSPVPPGPQNRITRVD